MSEGQRASRGAINPVIHLIFARCSVILVCQPLGKQNLQCNVARAMLRSIIRFEIEPPLRIHNQYLQYVKLAMKLLLFYEFQPQYSLGKAWQTLLYVYLGYGIPGCGVFKGGIQNQKGFGLKINCIQIKLPKFENWSNGEVSKRAKICLSKSIFYVKKSSESF